MLLLLLILLDHLKYHNVEEFYVTKLILIIIRNVWIIKFCYLLNYNISSGAPHTKQTFPSILEIEIDKKSMSGRNSITNMKNGYNLC